MIELPAGYEMITRGGAAIAVQERYRDRLLARGIDDPERLLQDAGAATAPSGRGAVPSLPLGGSPEERMMVRRYLRGGLLRFVNRDLYLDGDRALRELALTVEAAREGIPTAEALAAVSVRAAGPLYRCFLFTRELAGCLDLPSFLRSRSAAGTFREEKRAALGHAAAAVRQMHDRGFFHADLNMKNILIAGEQPESLYIIDWDKSYRRPSLADAERAANAVRFCRSMLKLAGKGVPVDAADADFFLRAYRDDDRFVEGCRGMLRRSVALRSRFWNLVSG